jgi:hypothetical protein
MIYRKNKDLKTTEQVKRDILNASELLLNRRHPKGNRIYTVDITSTNASHEKDLQFILMHKMLKPIYRDYSKSFERFSHLFVIEYPEVISRGNYLPTNCNVHAHLVVNTSIPLQQIEFYANRAFMKADILPEDITKRDDKEIYINYLIKQGKENNFLSHFSYDYRIRL